MVRPVIPGNSRRVAAHMRSAHSDLQAAERESTAHRRLKRAICALGNGVDPVAAPAATRPLRKPEVRRAAPRDSQVSTVEYAPTSMPTVARAGKLNDWKA